MIPLRPIATKITIDYARTGLNTAAKRLLAMHVWLTCTCMGKSCSFGLPRVPVVNCCQFMYLVISLFVLRAGYVI